MKKFVKRNKTFLKNTLIGISVFISAGLLRMLAIKERGYTDGIGGEFLLFIMIWTSIYFRKDIKNSVKRMIQE